MRRLLVAALLLTQAACGAGNPAIAPEPRAEPSPPSSVPDWTITAVEYEFQGAPVLLSEGEYTFTLENAGKEKHELYLFYISGKQSVEELLELPKGKLSRFTQAVDRAVAPTADLPASFTAGLVPGRFGYVCFFPAPDGTLHSSLGMRGEFTVA